MPSIAISYITSYYEQKKPLPVLPGSGCILKKAGGCLKLLI